MSKVRSLEEAVAMVPDGATIGIGGLSMNATPMAFVRELIRQEKRDLELLAIVNVWQSTGWSPPAVSAR